MSEENFRLTEALKAHFSAKCDSAHEATTRTSEELLRIWDNLGIPLSEAEQRYDAFMELMTSTAANVRRGEVRLEAEAIELNTQLGREIDELYAELQLDNNVNYANIQPEDRVFELKVKLEAELNRLLGIKDEMLEGVRGLKEREEALCATLDMPQLNINADRVPKAEDVRELESHVKLLEDEKVRRITAMRELRDEGKDLWEELGCQPSDGFEGDFLNDRLRLSRDNLRNAERCVEALRNQVAKLKEAEERREAELELLWSRLDSDKVHVKVFREKHFGIKPEQISMVEAELRKLREEKVLKIGQFVGKVRGEIGELGGKLMYGPETFAKLPTACNADVPPSQAVLDKLEEVANELRLELQARGPLLRKVERWNTMLLDYARVETDSKDPNTLKNRGGGLLLLQKERKKLEKMIPDTYYNLRREVLDWDANHPEKFMVNDEAMIDKVEKDFAKTGMGPSKARVPLSAASATKGKPVGPPGQVSVTKSAKRTSSEAGFAAGSSTAKVSRIGNGDRAANNANNEPGTDMTLESVDDFSTFRTGLDSASKALQARRRSPRQAARMGKAGQGLKALARPGGMPFRSPLPSRYAAATPLNEITDNPIHNILTSTQVTESPSKKTVFPKRA